jgi:GNAT superfamily N-acetyltransferase
MTGSLFPGGRLLLKAVTAGEWPDLQRLFGPRGCGGCWCMWWRITRAEFAARRGEGNRRALEALIAAGSVPGLLAYLEGEPAAWCSVAPREHFPVLDRSPNLKRVDDVPVWSIVCFYVAPACRGSGLMDALIAAAVEYAGSRGAEIVEAYPLKSGHGLFAAGEFYTGTSGSFRRAGFREAARRSGRRLIMRRVLSLQGNHDRVK